MDHRMRAAVALLGLGLALHACGDDGSGGTGSGTDEPTGDEPAGGGAGGDAYEGELEDGTRLRIRLDVDAADEAVAPFEELRAAGGGSDVTWIVGELTVPDGNDATGRFVTFVEAGADPIDDDPLDDGDGVTNAEFACSLIDEWASGAEDSTAAFALATDLLDGPCGGQTLQVLAPAGETTTYVMAYEGDLPAFERVFAGLVNELSPS